MKYSKISRLVIRSVFFLLTGVVYAQERKDSVPIYYRQGEWAILPEQAGNGARLDSLSRFLGDAFREGRLKGVVIRSYASPEGGSRRNDSLVRLRSRSVGGFLADSLLLPAGLIRTEGGGVAWVQLRRLVAGSDMRRKDSVVSLIDHIPVWVTNASGQVTGSRKQRLMDLDGGRAWREMQERFFPSLRYSMISVSHEESPAEAVELPIAEEITLCGNHDDNRPSSDAEGEAGTEVAGTLSGAGQERFGFRPLVAVKTNLLAWGTLMPDFKSYVPVPNLEVEWFVNHRWSVTVTGAYVSRRYDGGQLFALSSYSVEPRFWLCADGRHRLLHAGIYGQAGDYDVQQKRIKYDGLTGRLFGGGVSLGAAIPFLPSFGMEAGLRVGYRHSKVKGYNRTEDGCYREITTADNHWGVTGLKLSLYYRFGKRTLKKPDKP